MYRWPLRIARKIYHEIQDHHRSYLRSKADRIQFYSGLGESSYLLYGLVRSMKPEVCVEIGSARGKSAAYIGMALKENGRGKLWAIDPHRRTDWNDSDSVDTFEIIAHNLRVLQLTDYVQIVRQTSDDAAKDWNGHIDMMFIDGDHSYAGIKKDWDLFVPHVREFGVVVFHDTLWDLRPDPRWSRDDMGVPKFVEDLREQGYPVLTIDQDCGVSMVQPVKGGIPLRKLQQVWTAASAG
jgi:predicted O-methyltransferase YrrM